MTDIVPVERITDKIYLIEGQKGPDGQRPGRALCRIHQRSE